MARRSPGEGSIIKRTTVLPGGRKRVRFLAQVSLGPRNDRRLITRTVRTRVAAAAALREMQADLEARRNPSRLSLGAYLRRWLDESARPTVSSNTLRGYEDAVIHLAPIADIPLDRLTAENIEAACNGMTTHRTGAKTQQAASAKTVRNVQVMLRRVLGQATQRGHIRRNVASLVPLRRVPRSSIEALTPERAREIMRAVSGDRFEAAYALALVGLRASEILGLARSDLDLGRATVTIRQQIAGSGPRAVLVETKTASSAATIPLPHFVVSRLSEHLARQDAERPVVPFGDSLVFVTGKGMAVNGSWLTKHFQSLLRKADLPAMRLHDLRHGAVSLLVGAGAHPRIAGELLRHAPGSRVTMERYAHVTAGQQRDAADLLDVALTESVTQSVTAFQSGVASSRP